MFSNKRNLPLVILLVICGFLSMVSCTNGLTPILDDWGLSSKSAIKEKFSKQSTITRSNIVQFVSDMDRESVEASLVLFPKVEASYVWQDDKTLAIEITEKLEKDIEFSLNIPETTLTKSGEALGKSVIQSFKVSGEAKIDFISPSGEIDDLDKNITVRFSKPMVSLTTLDNQDDCPIEITPALAGKCVWITSSTFQYRPDQGFPIGAKYEVNIASGLETIAGDKTINSESVEIITPKFSTIGKVYEIPKDAALAVVFNAPISLDNFKENFQMQSFDIDDLDINYLETESEIKGEIDINKKVVTIKPKLGDWGYGNKYNYTLKSGLKSSRGNISIGEDIVNTIEIQDFVTNYSSFIYKTDNVENKEIVYNIDLAQNKSIITKTNPKIILELYEEIDLDKNLFKAVDQNGNNINFDLKYLKKIESLGEQENIVEDKKGIILELYANNLESMDLFILVPDTSDELKLSFNTKDLNQVVDYKFVDYSKSCISFKNNMGYDSVEGFFEFNGDSDLYYYLSKISKYTRDDDCEYVYGKNNYILKTKLNPETNYNLKIQKNLLDVDNYPLSSEYNTSFTTGKALNKDKTVSLLDPRSLILVPKDLSPLTVGVATVNLDKLSVKICEGDADITNSNNIKNEVCKTENIDIDNIGFNKKITELNLEDIFAKAFTKQIVTLEVNKLDEDKTEYELEKNYAYSNKASYNRSNTSIVLKSNKENILRLSDFKTGETLTNLVENISTYSSVSNYVAGKYLGKKKVFKNIVGFEAKSYGLYELSGNISGFLVIKLKTGEQLLLDSSNNYTTSSELTYITTDRPIYKPGDTVNIKGVYRKETAMGYELKDVEKSIIIRDSNYKDLLNEKVKLSENATFDYQIILDKNASLGSYSIMYGKDSVRFSVEEYEKPDFKVELDTTNKNYIYGDSPEAQVQADYYIGNPLSNATGYYSVIASDYDFDGGITSGYIWGSNNDFFRYWERNYYDDTVEIEYKKDFELDSNGSTKLDIDTTKTISDKVYDISATVIDPNTKKSISSNSSFKLLNSEVFVGMKHNKYYYEFGDTVNLDFVTVDLEGNKLGNKDIDFKVYKIDYKTDEKTLAIKKQETVLKEASLTTNNLGEASISYEIDAYGEYRFEIELANNKYKTIKTIYVSGGNLIESVDKEHELNLLKDKEIYDLGDNAEIVIQSPVTGVKALVTVEKLDEVLYYDVIDIDSSTTKYDLEIKKEFLPNFELKVFLIKTTDDSEDIIPNYYLGEIPIKVNLDTIKLKTEVKTDKSEYLPSDTTTIELTILDNDGNPVNGEAVLSVVDESLLALKNNDKDIINFFYGEKSNYISTLNNMVKLIKEYELNQEKEDTQYSIESELLGSLDESVSFDSMAMSKGISNSTIMAGAAMGSSESSSNETKLRTDFKDSAYYNGVVEVVDGKAIVTIPKLPDNLTTWVIKGFTVTKDTKVGNFEGKFQVKKTLNLLPSIARFFVSGDEMEITAVLVNNSTKDLEVNPSLEITNAEVLENQEYINIKANSQVLLVWKVKIDEMKNNIDWNSYFSDITIKVVSDNLEDSLNISKKIIPYSTPEYSFTNGSTYDLSYEEKIFLTENIDQTQGQLDITYGATILASLLDNVDNIASMPLDNFYSTVSALKKAAILKGLYESSGRLDEFKKIEVVDSIGVSHNLDKLITEKINTFGYYQNYDGAMMVYTDCSQTRSKRYCSNFGLTGDFLSLAKVLEKNGYSLDEDIIQKAYKYYISELEDRISIAEEEGGIYRDVDTFYQIIGYDSEFLKKYILTDRFINTSYEFSNISKLKLVLILQQIDSENELIQKYIKELKNSTMIEARGTLLAADNYSRNNIVSTSLALRVFINNSETEKLLIENLTRWLLAQKRENGEFGSSYDSAEVLTAITEYINYTQELDKVSFEAKGYLNYEEFTSNSFTDTNKFSLKQESYPLSEYIIFGEENSLGFEKMGEGKLYYDVGLRYFLPIDQIEARDEGIIVSRNYYDYDEYNNAYEQDCIFTYYCYKQKVKNIETVSGGNKGDMLVGEIEIIVPSERNNVVVNNFIPAGAEIINTSLDTTSNQVKNISGSSNSSRYSGFTHTEIKDDRVYLYADHLYEGTYKYTYVIKLNHVGTYHNRPAVAEELKKPEIWGRSRGEYFEIK